MPKVTLQQKNLILKAEEAENLMTFLLSKKIPVASSCLGEGICSKCRVKIISGVLPQPSDLEKQTLARNKCSIDERLSCQIMLESDLIITASYW